MQEEGLFRLIIFLILFIFFAILELIIPFRQQFSAQKYKGRARNNLILSFINTAILRVIFPSSAVGIAFIAEKYNIGLLHLLNVNAFIASILAFLYLDFCIYAQHVAFHKIPLFWRFHQMHHSDLEFDTSTGLRFHPIEIILSITIKSLAIVIIGAPVIAVFIFEVILNAGSLFTHTNIALNEKWDKRLRLLFVTPSMHRIHHSVIPRETDSNYGFNFSCWDRLCKTYIKYAKNDPKTMKIGLSYFREDSKQTIKGLLMQPFYKKKRCKDK